MTTGVAVNAKEAVREHATAQEGAKLLLDEARSRLISVCSARQEAIELLANHLMEESRFRLMARVLGQSVPGRDRVGASRKKLGPMGPHGTTATHRSLKNSNLGGAIAVDALPTLRIHGDFCWRRRVLRGWQMSIQAIVFIE
ncbi:MAG: hypothetical protein MJE66_10150 [Proteobacteria bacterium]|nr:hypothetical protein [Pseudomonadota bacterium]